jgi:hypothetical protein
MDDREELTYAADEVRGAVAELREALQAAAVMDGPDDPVRSQASVLGGIELQILDLQAGEPTRTGRTQPASALMVTSSANGGRTLAAPPNSRSDSRPN